jgi:very-short-patch-repair endonuclease
VKEFDAAALARAQRQRYLVARAQLLEDGAHEDLIRRRVKSGRWVRQQAGVYQLDHRPSRWEDKLMAALLAAGDGAFASHRAALILWDLDGISSAPVEITVPHAHGPMPEGTVVHRTRRPVVGTTLSSVPVTSIERTLLDCAALLPSLIIAKAVESALRRRLTTVDQLFDSLKVVGGRGVRGTKRLRGVLSDRVADTPTGSGSETEAIHHLRQAGVAEPVLQHRFETTDGNVMIPDFYWPDLGKAIEIDGIDAHDSADKLDHDLQRQNSLMDLGVDLRRFSARLVRRDPERFVQEVRRFLAQ